MAPSLPRLPQIPRLPLLPDPLRRARIPRDLDSVTVTAAEDDPREVGMSEGSIERIWASAQRLYRSGVHPGMQLCLRREGRVVLDRAIGHARGNGPGDLPGETPEAMTTETPVTIYSASKAITAMVAHLLHQRGVIDINDRVCEYIPEYAANRKEGITIGHVLSHRAGVPNLPGELLELDNLDDHEMLVDALCAARPMSRPGRALAYHAISGGFIVDEIVRRATGRDVRDVLGAEILDPLGFRWTNYGVALTDVDLVARNYATGPPVLPPISTLLQRALGRSVPDIVELSNDPRFLTGIIPAGNTVTTANELSRFFELLRCGGELDGTRIFEQRIVNHAITEHSYREIDLTLGFPTRYGLGFMLGADVLSTFGPDTELVFGHLGFTNILAWADPARYLSGALITTGKPVLYPELADLWSLMRRIGLEAPVDRRRRVGVALV